MFKDKTVNLRLKTSLTVMKILNPTVHKWVYDTVKNAHCIPRPFTENLKYNYHVHGLVGAEIGFGFGINAENLLKELHIKKLYCIDPFIAEKYWQGNRQISTYSDKTKSRLSKLKQDPRVKFIPCFSSKATEYIIEPLDFVYIDGNHTYTYVLNDLKKYYPLVKNLGYIGGHDYIFGQQGVIAAVQDFAVMISEAPEIQFPDFWFQKCEGKQELKKQKKLFGH